MHSTDSAPSIAGPDSTRFILMHTSHPGNVGSAARALKVMGFSDMVLVAPRYPNVQRKADAISLSSGAHDVLLGARIVETLDEALEGITFACATAMTPRDFGPPTHAPRALFETLAANTRDPHRLAIVFGSERFGMSNEDVYRCHACLSIPTAPGYGSLNLAQAVQLIAYDWRQTLGGFDVAPRTADPKRADGTAVNGLLSHWQQSLETIGFFDPTRPKKLLPRLRQLIHRAQLTVEEVHILRGIARAMTQRKDSN